ncbi:MAG: hypothetical protein C4305_03850, partial [Thermoleophilia bacterium]
MRRLRPDDLGERQNGDENAGSAPTEVAQHVQLELFPAATTLPGVSERPVLPPPAPPPAPPLHDARRLSYSALALFARCPYRYFAERVAGMRALDPHGMDRDEGGDGGLAAAEIGDAVHAVLERLDLSSPALPSRPRLEEIVRSRYPRATQEAIERVQALVAGYCSSSLACRLSSLPGLVSEQPFAFEHEGVLLHGRLDVLHVSSGRALVVDFKTNALAGTPPDPAARVRPRLPTGRGGGGRGGLPVPGAARGHRLGLVLPGRPPPARARPLGRDRSHPRGAVPPSTERDSLLRLSRLGRRLRRAAPRPRVV